MNKFVNVTNILEQDARNLKHKNGIVSYVVQPRKSIWSDPKQVFGVNLNQAKIHLNKCRIKFGLERLFHLTRCYA